MNFKNYLLLLILVYGAVFKSEAQERDNQYNPNSLSPIPKYEHLYRIRVWRELDLREKQNRGFFARGNEITKLIINGLKSGELSGVYYTDSLVRKMSKTDFLQNLVSQQGQVYPAWSPSQEWYAGDRITLNGKNYEALADNTGSNPATNTEDWQETSAGQAIEFLASEMYKITIQEDVIFDKRRSRLYYDIQSMQLSAFDLNTGTFKDLGWFKYKDLDQLFRNHAEESYWFNRHNDAENRNYADAFLLRLFHATIQKVQNPNNESIYEVYATNGRPYAESVLAREWEEMKLMEREHNLWEF